MSDLFSDVRAGSRNGRGMSSAVSSARDSIAVFCEKRRLPFIFFKCSPIGTPILPRDKDTCLRPVLN
jgi:hypothetical protein